VVLVNGWFDDAAPSHGARPRPYAQPRPPSAEELLGKVEAVAEDVSLAPVQQVARIRLLLRQRVAS
jgi:hypothetical protein